MYNKLNKKEQEQLLKLKKELLTDVTGSPSKNTTIYEKLRKIADKNNIDVDKLYYSIP